MKRIIGILYVFLVIFVKSDSSSDSTRKIAKFLCLETNGGGYTNQILNYLSVVGIAEKCGFNLRLSRFAERDENSYHYEYSQNHFKPIPLTSVFNFKTAAIPALAEKVIEDIGTTSCSQVYDIFAVAGRQRGLSLDTVNCDSIPNGSMISTTFDGYAIPFPTIVNFLANIDFKNPLVRATCLEAKRKIEPYTGWHPRKEKDWGESYNTSSIKLNHKNVFMISGMGKESSGESNTFFHKSDFPIHNFTATEKLQFDFCMGAESNQFIGTLLSTFSYYIWIYRLENKRNLNTLVANRLQFWSDTMDKIFVEPIENHFSVSRNSQIVCITCS